MSATSPNANVVYVDFASQKQATCAEVWRLLHYAISDANIDLSKEKPELIKQIVPVLQKEPEMLTDNDIAILLQAYNELSQLVYPATNESLRLNEKIIEYERDAIQGKSGSYSLIIKQVKNSYTNFWAALWIVILVFIVYQSYIYFISDTLQKVSENLVEIKTIEDKLHTAIAASSEPDKSRENLETKYPFKDLFAERQIIWLQLNRSYCVLKNVSLFWVRWYPNDGIQCDVDETAKDKANDTSGLNPTKQCQDMGSPANEICERAIKETQEKAVRENFFAGATAILRVSNYLVLPTMLGLLGSLAYVIRGILDSFSKSSFVLGTRRRWGMRVALGPLLGLISGIVIAPNIKDFKELSFSPLVWGFLMGYSVEFAFSLFDFLIQKGCNAIGYTNAKPEEKSQESTRHPSPLVKAIRPKRDSVAEGSEGPTPANEFMEGGTTNFGTSQEKAVSEDIPNQENTPKDGLPATDGGVEASKP